MNDRTARWTESARAALRAAESESRARNHDFIGQEHLILGLLQVEDGAAAEILRVLDIRPEPIRAEIESMVGRAAIAPPKRPYTEGLEKALDLAVNEQTGFEHPQVGTDHLLLGLFREGKGVGADILKARNLTLNKLRDRALILRESGFRER